MADSQQSAVDTSSASPPDAPQPTATTTATTSNHTQSPPLRLSLDAVSDLNQALTSPPLTKSAGSSKAAADAQRAMSRTNNWRPNFARRQSWDKEEHKHSLQMTRLDDVKAGPGFSERGAAGGD